MHLYSNPDGTLAAVAPSELPSSLWAGLPVAGGSELNFDDATNAALVTDLRANAAHYRLVAGVLTKDGATVAVAAPGAASTFTDRRALLVIKQALDSDTQPTNAQLRQLLRILLRDYLARNS